MRATASIARARGSRLDARVATRRADGARRRVRPRAQKFQRLSSPGPSDEDGAGPTAPREARDDECLPDSLFDAVGQAATATAAAMGRGVAGSVVELLVPELWDPLSGNVMSDAGDQLKVWEISREFLTQLNAKSSRPVRAVFPDAGAAAMLRARWGDGCGFEVASVDDRNLVGADFEGILAFAAPDPMSLEKVQKSCGQANEQGCPVVLLNPRLASGDAGVGLNVRRMRENFLGKMTVTYSLRPLPWCNGSIFKSYPGAWQLFLEDPEEPGRFKLIDEFAQRPAGEELDEIVEAALRPKGEDGEAKEKTAAEKVLGMMREMQRFARSLSQ